MSSTEPPPPRESRDVVFEKVCAPPPQAPEAPEAPVACSSVVFAVSQLYFGLFQEIQNVSCKKET